MTGNAWVTGASDLLADLRPDGSIDCRLCYRLCRLEPGESGPCGHRTNRAGMLELVGHGELSTLQRSMSGINGDTFASFKPGRPAAFVGGTRCTAGCTFCSSGKAVHNPDAVPLAEPSRPVEPELDGLTSLPALDMFYGARAYMHPVLAARTVAQLGAVVATLGMNEPTLTIEWSLEFARECAVLGVDVQVQTNGFTTPEGIAVLAPWVSAVHVGIKGSADPAFYDRLMRSPGGEVAALDSLRMWREAGVHVIVGDLLAAPHMQSREAFEDHARRFYERVHADLGSVVDVYTMIALTPAQPVGVRMGQAATRRELWPEYVERVDRARQLARDAGLPFWRSGPRALKCSCGQDLLSNDDICGDALGEDAPCAVGHVFCPFQTTTTPDVTPDSRCNSCDREVPVIPVTARESADARAVIERTWREQGPSWLATWQGNP